MGKRRKGRGKIGKAQEKGTSPCVEPPRPGGETCEEGEIRTKRRRGGENVVVSSKAGTAYRRASVTLGKMVLRISLRTLGRDPKTN